jgi:hypothetical protein
MKLSLTLLTIIFASLATVGAADNPAVDLFNGKDLTGWVQKGGKAQFTVENGEIVGTTVTDTPNSFLCTEREFSDFILELEFKVDQGLNSGVQIRSRAGETMSNETWNGKVVKFPAGRVHGLQVEIDPSDRAWTAGIQCEGGGDWRWLNDLKNNEPARKAFKKDEWNKLRIEAKGDSIKTWLNGVPAADLKNDVIPKGFIALQVHSIGKRTDVLHVRFRNLRLQELP